MTLTRSQPESPAFACCKRRHEEVLVSPSLWSPGTEVRGFHSPVYTVAESVACRFRKTSGDRGGSSRRASERKLENWKEKMFMY